MKIINVGLSVLITMGLAISPIHANDFDVADESNEQSVVNNDDTNSNEEVDSNSETVQVQSISVSTEDNTTEYSLDENEVKNIKLVVTKVFTDGHTEQTTDYQYDIYGISSNLYLSNSSGSLQNNVTYKGSDNEISVTKTSKGTGSFSVKVHVDGLSSTCTLQFNGTNSVNVTLDANDGQFEDGTTTYTYKCDIGGEYISPAVIAPKGYSFVGWYDENGVWLGTLNPNTWELIDNKTLGKSWYYINEKGNFMGDCKATINGQTYYFGSYSRGGGSIDTQCLVTNRLWYDRATKEYHWINKDGTGFEDYDGWHRSNQGWYAYFENGKAVQGYKTIDGKSYLFNGGYIYTGVLNYDGKAYVCDSQQNIVSYNEGWNSYEGQWYYIRNGKALMNVMVDGYYLDGFLTTTGKTWLNSAQNVVLLNNGKLAQNEWIEYYGVWYYADNNGHVVKNQWVGDHYLNNEGVMVTNDWIGNYHVGADGKWDATR